MKTKFYTIEDIIIMEIETNNEFEYYVRDCRHFFETVIGVEKKDRISRAELVKLYHVGYFDFQLERD